MKKILAALAAIAVAMSLTGCGDDDKKSNSTNSTTSLSNTVVGGNSDDKSNSESDSANGNIRPEIKNAIDEYEVICDKYYKLLEENMGADEERKTEIALDIWDYNVAKEKKSLELTDLAESMSVDELEYCIAVKEQWNEKIEQTRKKYYGITSNAE
ncbi:MAG: hypothetical protein K2N06_10750 [Oscillospiraceae bacterium]|nr:hypothetical protein [Oscillospiraceae bacterium]